MTLPEWAHWLRLTLTPQLGPQTARRLLAACGSAQAIWAESDAALATLLGPALLQALRTPPPDWMPQVQRTAAWLAQAPGVQQGTVGHALWTLADAAYPPLWLDMPDPPLLVYAQGAGVSMEDAHMADTRLWAPPALALVGSRNPTPQGRENAYAFARQLRAAGLRIVSGLALGIDGAAHAGALSSAVPSRDAWATVAVVGTGLDRVYPRQHAALAQQVAAQGVILSELPLGMGPLGHHFPRRNRLIAGLSQGVLVVEAALQSGSLITADLALAQGKEVFAMPGSIHSTLSRGCHLLIRQGAKLVETANDVLEELPIAAPQGPKPLTPGEQQTPSGGPPPGAGSVDGNQAQVLQALGHDAATLDVLHARTGLDAAALQAALTGLELLGRVARMPGGLFQPGVPP